MTNKPLSVLGGISAEHFFKEYWQKKPLLVRQAFPDLELPIQPDDLAGLSLEDEVESRIILEKSLDKHWVLKCGPFEEDAFTELPDTHWTLLIQQLDAWVPEVNALKQHFDFIPNWRIDDIMASYAPVGGSVGPHFDFYDVFLIQSYGHREWNLGQWCDEHSHKRDDTALSILKHFDTQERWVLEPGDMLYVPPKLAHYGIAQDDCITLSVGFRAPRQVDLLSDYADHLASGEKNPFFEDPDRTLQNDSGQLANSDIQELRSLMLQTLQDENQFSAWLGRYLSEPKNMQTLIPADQSYTTETLEAQLHETKFVVKNEGSRIFYTQNEDGILLFADGTNTTLPNKHLTFVQLLCSKDEFPAQLLLEHCTTLPPKRAICMLLEQGSLRLETDV